MAGPHPINANLSRSDPSQCAQWQLSLFWKGDWNNSIYEEKYPRAFSYCKNGDIPIQAFLNTTDLSMTFHLPLSVQAHDELRQIQREVANVELTNANDTWTCCWGAQSFKTTSYYSYYFREITAHVAFKWLWKTKCTAKIRVFGWLLLSDRLNTRNMLKRRHYNIGTNLDCLCNIPNFQFGMLYIDHHCISYFIAF